MTAPASPSPSSPKPGFDPRAKSPRRRRLWPFAAGAVFLTLIAVGLWPKAIPVEVAKVTRGTLRITVDEEGETRVINRYVIASPVAGQLRRVEWKPGAVIEAGKTVLAVLETAGADLLDARSLAQAQARVHGAEAAREQVAAQQIRAQAAARLARTELERAQSLFEKGSASRQELDTAAMRDATAAQEYRAAEFGQRVADYELEQARAMVQRGQPGSADSTTQTTVTITSPVSGRVLRVFQESSRLVPAGFALLEVGDLTDLEVKVEVLSRDGVAIQPGAAVSLEQWGGPTPLPARVRLVEPSAFRKISALGVEEQRVNVIADFVDPVEKRPGLGDAYRVEARIAIWENRDVVKVPAGALFQQQGKWKTFVVENGRAHLREVQAGRSNGIETQILEGVSPGAVVIVYPGDRLTDGRRVSLIEASR